MKNTILALALFCAFAFITCTKENLKTTASNNNVAQNASNDDATSAGYKTYIIKSGANYCSPNPLVFISKSQIKFNAIFDSSCIYSTVDPKNQADVNKLYGFSDCGTHHLVNSARIGWRWYNNQLQIMPFVHLGGEFTVGPVLAVLPIGAVANCRITCLPGKYEFEVNGNITQMDRGCSGNYTRYKLYPYFGGTETAPRDIKIMIQELR